MNGQDDFQAPEIIEVKDTAVEAITMAERRLNHLKKFIKLAITVTNHQDWVMMGGTPYLQASGAQKVARLFGIAWKNIQGVKEDKVDSKGGYYQYTYTGTFFLAGHETESVEFNGTCSSRDKFFGQKGGELKDTEEVDELNIKKKAWTNLLNRGIKGILGLNNLTVEDLKIAGIDLSESSNVDYKNGSRGGTSKPKAKADLAEKIRCACLYMAEGDEKKAADFYHNAPGNADFEVEQEDGSKKKIIAKKPDQLSEKHAGAVYGRLKKEFEKLGMDISVCVHEYGKGGDTNGTA